MMKNYKLANGLEIPSIGFGTWQSAPGEETYNAVTYALKAGYRHIDTAYAYHNEDSVGQAIRDSKIDPNEIFITTKLPAEIKTTREIIEHFNSSLKSLGKIDLYLIHAPWPWSNIGQDCTEGNIEAWKALVNIYNEGKVGAIGVSNFSVTDLKAVISATGFVPMANQIRFFIGNTQEPLTAYCQQNNILVEAYSPFATGKILDDAIVMEMAEKYKATPAGICLGYCLARNTLPLPKSIKEDRIIANLSAPVELAAEDVARLNTIVTRDELKRPLRS